jgi:hypothetical protein
MLVSQQVMEWQAEAEVRTRREDLLWVLEAVCNSPVPADVAWLMQACTDRQQLLRLFRTALKIKSYDEFRVVMKD